MKCQRHDELTILSNSCSGADEREHEHCANSFSRAYLVLAAVAVFLSLGRYVFMHINYLEPKPLTSNHELLFLFLDTLSPFPPLPSPPPLDSLLFACRGKRTSTSSFLCPSFEIIVFQLTRLFASKAGRNSWPPLFGGGGRAEGGFN